MRTALRWLALAAVPALASACFSSSSSGESGTDSAVGSDDGAADAPVQPGSDGAPAEASTHAPDASLDAGSPGAPDAPADAPADHLVEGSVAEASADAGVPTVTVSVRSALGPEAGVAVVFEDGFGQVLTYTYTDAFGVASGVVPAGSQATVLMGTTLAPQIATIQAVAPGDVLAFYDTSSDSVSSFSVAVDVAPDAGPPPGTSTVYGQIGSCDLGYPIPGTSSVSSTCQSGGQFPLLAIAQAGADGGYADLAYAYSKNNLVPTDGGAAAVTLEGPWYTAFGSQTVAMANVDAGAASASSAYLSLSQITSNLAKVQTSYDSFPPDPSASFPTYVFFDDDLQAEANVYWQHYPTLSVTGMVQRGLGDAGTTTFDFGQALPLLASAAIDTAIAAQPILTWQPSYGSLASADGIMAQLTWTDSSPNGSVQGTWTLVAPPTVQSITAPAVPSSVASWVPQATALFANPTVLVVEADFIATYGDLRAKANVLPLSYNLVRGYSGSEAPLLPVDGTLRYTAFAISGD